MALVKFATGTASQFALLESKDENTIYVITDSKQIYKGDVCLSGGIYTSVASLPGTGDVNTLYLNTTDGSVSYWDGTKYVTLIKATGKTIASPGDDDHLATTKAVVDYVTSQMADLDVGALEGRVDTLETEMDEAQGNITTLQGTVATKADKATTLAGYGIIDAYTKGEADAAISAAVANADHLKREIVAELPDAGEADENTIYMVPQDEGSTEDPGTSTSHYNEYMLINGAFELVGSSQVDLSGYATETFVTGAIGALDVADTAVANQYVSQVVETDGKIAVTRVPLPVTSVTEGSANGTIAVNGANVNVHGLGTAAYTDADAYEAAGAADAAIAALDKPDSAQAGQYVSAVSQEDGVITVTRAPLPVAATLVEGTANGTVKFNGTDVPVHGLGSAAYTESSAYATSAQGALADTALQKADITTGATQGTIAVEGTDVAVNGLGDAAYTDSADYATAAQGTKADEAHAALTWQTL